MPSLARLVPLVGVMSVMSAGMLGAPRSAYADDRETCVAASENAQRLKKAGKLGAARVDLETCAGAQCPTLIQQDCAQWLTEVIAVSPTIVPAAKDRTGRALTDVRVYVDGKLTVERLDGQAFVLDPGVHTVRFEAKGAPPIDEPIVARQGEKNRALGVIFAMPDERPPVAGAASHHDARGPSHTSPPIAAYVVGGLGLAALGVAVGLDLGATSSAHDLRSGCAPRCSQSDVDDVETRYTIAGVTAAVGAAAILTSVVLLFLHDGGGAKATTTSARAVEPGLVRF